MDAKMLTPGKLEDNVMLSTCSYTNKQSLVIVGDLSFKAG